MKRKIAIAAGILVTAVSTISGSYAYYQDSVTVTNHISTGDVNIGIQEYEKDGDTEKVYAGPKEGIVLPSQTISKIPRITNYAETCYIRVKTTYSGEASDSVSNVDTEKPEEDSKTDADPNETPEATEETAQETTENAETDAITCFNIAQDFCEKYLAGKYEYVFSVHTDHAHMHAHIVFNSVSLVDGVKYHYSDGQWKSNIQPITDQLCEKYGLKKLTYVPGKRKGVDYGTWREKKDPSGSQRLREAIDMAIAQSDSYDDFLSIMRKSYQVKIGFSQKWNSEYLSFKDFKTPAGRYRRNYVLGKSYTVASIQKRISLNKMEIPESLKRLPPHIRGFESSIGSGFRSANGLYLTQHQKRYMIPYWRLKNSERTVTSGTGNIREYSKEADRNLRDLQTVQDNKIRTVQDLSSRLDELNQMTDSIRRELRAIQSSREDSETENVISEYLSIQSAFANAAVPIEMEGKFENRLDEIEENYPIEELIHQKESNSKKEKQLQKEIKNLQQASRRLSKLKKIQKR